MAAHKKQQYSHWQTGGGPVFNKKTPSSVNKAKKTLLLLAKSKPAAAKKIIQNANSNVLKAISEICLNMLNGVVPLTPKQKKDYTDIAIL